MRRGHASQARLGISENHGVGSLILPLATKISLYGSVSLCRCRPSAAAAIPRRHPADIGRPCSSCRWPSGRWGRGVGVISRRQLWWNRPPSGTVMRGLYSSCHDCTLTYFQRNRRPIDCRLRRPDLAPESETRAMRKAQTEPHVSFTVQPSESHVGIVEMIVENHGPGAAKNIGFALSEDLAIDENPSAALSQTGLFRHGVTYLSPRQRFRFFLVSTIDYPELLAKEPVRVEIAYETVAGEKKVGEYFIDFCVLEGMWGCCSGVPFRHKGEAVPTLSRPSRGGGQQLGQTLGRLPSRCTTPRPRRWCLLPARRATRRPMSVTTGRQILLSETKTSPIRVVQASRLTMWS